MAGLGWNMNSSSANGFNVRPRLPTTPIACRICNLVVANTPALIDHVESSHTMHSNNNNINNKQLAFLPNSQRQANTLANNPVLEISRILPAEKYSVAFPLTPRNINMIPVPAPQPFGNRYSFGLRPLVMQPTTTTIPPRRVVEEPPNDGTKPFLQMLDKPYSCMATLNGDMMRNNSDADMLDLTLKL